MLLRNLPEELDFSLTLEKVLGGFQLMNKTELKPEENLPQDL